MEDLAPVARQLEELGFTLNQKKVHLVTDINH